MLHPPEDISDCSGDTDYDPYSPSPGAYAVVRLNPVEMVKVLEDSTAAAEAEAMEPKAYLVWLNLELALPFPDQPWYRFHVCPIGLGLRPRDTETGITPEMCVPIGPNAYHPAGREPVHPEGCFPYTGCYHWLGIGTTVRVRGRPEGFSEENGAKLSSRSRLRMERMWSADWATICAAAAPAPAASEDLSGTETCEPSEGHSSESAVDRRALVGTGNGRVPLTDGRTRNNHDEVDHASFVSSPSIHSATGSISALAEMDIFSGPDGDVELVPLVDVWTSNLADHLRQEDIPSPDELFAEFDEITRIVKRARVRAYAAMLAHVPASSSDQETSHTEHLAKDKNWRSMKIWGNLRARAKRVSSRISDVMRVPFLPVWP